MKKFLYTASFALTIGAAMLSSVSINAKPKAGTTISCDASNLVCARTGNVTVYGKGTISVPIKATAAVFATK